MTSTLFTAKLLGCVSAVGGAGAAGTYFAVNTFADKQPANEPGSQTNKNENRPVRQSPLTRTIVVAGAAVTGESATATTLDSYQCKLPASADTASTCKITQLTITNGWMDLGGIKKAKQAAVIQKSALAETTNYFKLEVDENFYHKVQIKPTNTIDIRSTSEPQKKFGNLTTLFKFAGKDVDFENTKYLLGKAGAGATAPSESETYACLPAVPASTSHYGTCTFYPFGSTTSSLSGAGYSNQNATSLLGTAATAALTANNYYLIEYSISLVKTKTAASAVVNVQTSDSNPATQKGSFKDVVPAILVGADGSKKAFILSETPSYSVVVQKTDAIADSKTLTHNQTSKNFQCKLAAGSAVNCNLVPLPFDASTKTSLTLDAVKAAAITTDLSITNSDTNPAFFRLDVDETFFNSFKTGTINTQAINVVEVKDGVASEAPLFTLNPLFSIGDDDSLHFDSSTFIINTADLTGSESSLGTLTPNKTRFCSFSDTDKGGSSAKTCSLIDLGSTLAESQTFMGSPITGVVETSKTYLVKFTTDGDNGFDKGAKGVNPLFIFEEGDDASADSRKHVAKFLAANVQAAIVVDASASAKYALILEPTA